MGSSVLSAWIQRTHNSYQRHPYGWIIYFTFFTFLLLLYIYLKYVIIIEHGTLNIERNWPFSSYYFIIFLSCTSKIHILLSSKSSYYILLYSLTITSFYQHLLYHPLIMTRSLMETLWQKIIGLQSIHTYRFIPFHLIIPSGPLPSPSWIPNPSMCQHF